MQAPEPLYMVRLALDAARLARLGVGLHLPPHQEDNGLLVHGLLQALFGKGAVQPHYVEPVRQGDPRGGRWIPILGYSARSGEELRHHAESFADPANYEACEWSRLAVKAMPPQWAPGAVLGFAVRACPVVRLSSATEVAGKDGQRQTFAAGTELDAWLHARFVRPQADEPVEREKAYVEWLQRLLEPAGRVARAELRSSRRVRLVRRTQGGQRKARVLERPEAVIEGLLEISDGEALRKLLRRGVGRHTAFGFGMLLLRPPGN